ncbi:hypothetical protein ACSBR1_009514 [Camellia fascicularis]
MRRRGSESGDFDWPIGISTKGAPNLEALSAQRCHAPKGLRIRRLIGQSRYPQRALRIRRLYRPNDVMRRRGSEFRD